MILYKLLDKFLMNDFINDFIKYLNSENPIFSDV